MALAAIVIFTLHPSSKPMEKSALDEKLSCLVEINIYDRISLYIIIPSEVGNGTEIYCFKTSNHKTYK